MKVDVAGVEFDSPVLLASGILGSTGESLNRVLREGAGGVVTKSVGTEVRKGHPGPNVFADDSGEYALNAVGLSNPSKEFDDEVEKVEGTTVVSIFGGTAEEFADLASHFEEYADCLELNVSCPHAEGYGTDIGADPDLTRDVTEAVVETVDVPVWVKLTPNVTDIAEIGLSAEEAGADAVVAINTVGAMAIDTQTAYPILGNGEGGMSGSAVKPIAVRSVYELYEALDIPIVGVGGVSSPDDAIEMMLAGASLVEVGTAVKDDIGVFDEISRGIDEYSDEKGWSHDEIVGKTHEVVKEAEE
ncbi:MAG: dihydroorotate dehydrogenase [Halobacteria archaeon]|nr:dihydroorotate dehydrogenase [Halobacteria archaeon]